MSQHPRSRSPQQQADIIELTVEELAQVDGGVDSTRTTTYGGTSKVKTADAQQAAVLGFIKG